MTRNAGVLWAGIEDRLVNRVPVKAGTVHHRIERYPSEHHGDERPPLMSSQRLIDREPGVRDYFRTLGAGRGGALDAMEPVRVPAANAVPAVCASLLHSSCARPPGRARCVPGGLGQRGVGRGKASNVVDDDVEGHSQRRNAPLALGEEQSSFEGREECGTEVYGIGVWLELASVLHCTEAVDQGLFHGKESGAEHSPGPRVGFGELGDQ